MQCGDTERQDDQRKLSSGQGRHKSGDILSLSLCHDVSFGGSFLSYKLCHWNLIYPLAF